MEAVRTTLGPRGMDKLIHTGNKVRSVRPGSSHPLQRGVRLRVSIYSLIHTDASLLRV